MAVALPAPAWQLALQTTTVRQFRRAVRLALLLAILGYVVYALEKYVLREPQGFAENPIEVTVRAFGLAHFLIGWLFLFTSRRLQNWQATGRLLVCTLAGVLLCGVFALFGGIQHPLCYLLFYGYFLIHEVRDEARMYQSYGDAPAALSGGEEVLDSLSRTAALLLLALLTAGYLGVQAIAGPSSTSDHILLPLCAFLGAVASVCGWTVHRFLQLVRRTYGNWGSLVSAHRPLLTVYVGIFLILALAAPLGSIGLLVLLHVTAWLVFVQHQLGNRPPAATRSLWSWLRSTPAGFWVLHVTVALLLMVLMAVRVYVWKRVGFLSALVAKGNFCYWALMHISMSFWSSR